MSSRAEAWGWWPVLAAEAMRELLAGPFKLEPAGTVDLNGFRAEEAWFLKRAVIATFG